MCSERRHHDQVAASERSLGECAVLRRLRAWLRALPLQRRVAYLATVAVALAVAVTSVAGYVTLRSMTAPSP